MADVQDKPLRDFTLSVRLRPDMREKLGMVADALGVSPATVASMAIGQYVAAQHTALTAAERTGKAMMEVMAAMLQGEETNQPSESESPCSSSKDSSALPPPSAAEPTKKPAKSSLSAQSFKSKRSTGADSSK
jgi:predicted transcriptional regulator